MINPNHPIAEILRRDDRYHFDAYLFVFESLRFAHEKLGLGVEQESEDLASDESSSISDLGTSDFADSNPGDLEPWHDEPCDDEMASDESSDSSGNFHDEDQRGEHLRNDETARHISGQQLCQAMRIYAHEQYGLLAKNVLNHWGIETTGDFGEIVFNLIEIGEMRKTPYDRREDFNDVFDFRQGFEHSFEIKQSKD